MGAVPSYRAVMEIAAINKEERYLYHNYRQDEEEVGNIIRKFREVDQLQHTDLEMLLENQEVLKRTRASTKYNGERYDVSMPFNDRNIRGDEK